MDENSNILSKADLQQMIERAGGSVAQLMAQQNTALVLLGGTMSAFMTANSGILNNALGALMMQSGLMNTQLGYNATALDNASTMNLLISTLSGDIGGMIDGLAALGNYGERMSGDVAKIAPLIDQMANSGGGVNDAANTTFGAIGALSGLKTAGDNFKVIGGLGDALKTFGSAAGAMGKMGALGPLLTTAAPLLVGGLAVAGVGTMAYKAFKNYQAKKEAQADNPVTERSIMDPVALENTENARSRTPSLPARDPLTEREIMDPDSVQIRRAGHDSTSGMVPNPLTGAENAAQYDRLGLADAGLIAEISALRQEMRRLADKPADRHVRSEIVINTLRTHQTLSEFKEMLDEVLKSEEQVSI